MHRVGGGPDPGVLDRLAEGAERGQVADAAEQAGIRCLGSQAPARNSDGKKTSMPMALAARAVGATAAMTRPTANSAAAPSTNATTNQPTLAGMAMPSQAAPITSTRARAATSMARLTATWAISSIAGLAGVVDRRRRMPFSR